MQTVRRRSRLPPRKDVDLRVTDANIDLLTRTVEADQQAVRVVADQDRAGTVPPSDLVTAQTQLDTAQSSLIALGVARAQNAHAIAVLVGKNPEELDLPHNPTLPALPSIPVGVPSTLLQRRPDIATAERQMAAQNAAIGVAVAAYYPTISLSALDGFTQSPLSGLLHIANRVWSLGGSATETLFDGGARNAQVAAAQASYDAAVANYRGTVLAAFQGVENDLSGLRVLAQQADVLERAVRDATRGTEIALNEYQAGTVDYTTVSTAQTTQLNVQQTALNVQQQRLLDTASLIGDLGGGWADSVAIWLFQSIDEYRLLARVRYLYHCTENAAALPVIKESHEPRFNPQRRLCDARSQSRLSPAAVPLHQSGILHHFVRDRLRCTPRRCARAVASGKRSRALRIHTHAGFVGLRRLHGKRPSDFRARSARPSRQLYALDVSRRRRPDRRWPGNMGFSEETGADVA